MTFSKLRLYRPIYLATDSPIGKPGPGVAGRGLERADRSFHIDRPRQLRHAETAALRRGFFEVDRLLDETDEDANDTRIVYRLIFGHSAEKCGIEGKFTRNDRSPD
jgi:hypothetical protein